MPTYPIELNLTNRPVLVVGGGSVAARKVAGLVQANAAVRVVSLQFAAELLARQEITREQRPYDPDCLNGVQLVFACTDDHPTNAAIAADARVRGIWCNIADDPEACDFHVPAIHRQGNIAVSVSTGGHSPALAALLRDRLASNLAPEWGILAEELGRARRILKTRVPHARVRRQILETLCTDCSLKLLTMRDRDAWRAWFERVTEHRLQGLEGIPDAV